MRRRGSLGSGPAPRVRSVAWTSGAGLRGAGEPWSETRLVGSGEFGRCQGRSGPPAVLLPPGEARRVATERVAAAGPRGSPPRKERDVGQGRQVLRR